MRRSRLIKAAVFGAAFMFSAAAYAKSSVYPFFYPMEKGEGVYYPPGTPVVKAQGQVEPVELGPFDPIFGPDTMTPRGGRPVSLVEGDGVPIGVVGNHCETPVTTCLLYHSSVQGGGCACKVGYGWRRGRVTP